MVRNYVLKYYGELNEEEKQGILDQIETTDMSILEACKHKEDLGKKRSDHTVGCHAVRRNRSKRGRNLPQPVSKRSDRAR